MPAKKGKVAQVAPGTDPTEGECVFVHLFGAFLCICSVRFCAFVGCVFAHLLGAFSRICSVRFCAFVRCVFVLFDASLL